MLKLLNCEFICLRCYFEIQFTRIFQYWMIGILIGSFISVFAKDRIHDIFRGNGTKMMGFVHHYPCMPAGAGFPAVHVWHDSDRGILCKTGYAEDWLAAFMIFSMLLNPQLIVYSTALGTTVLTVRLVSCFLCGAAAGLLIHLF